MQINRATDYAIRVMIHLAALPPGSKAQLIGLEHATGVRGHFSARSCSAWCTLASSLRSVQAHLHWKAGSSPAYADLPLRLALVSSLSTC